MTIPHSTRLYAFLDREVLQLTRRARFFRMMELFLGSLALNYSNLSSSVFRGCCCLLPVAIHYYYSLYLPHFKTLPNADGCDTPRKRVYRSLLPKNLIHYSHTHCQAHCGSSTTSDHITAWHSCDWCEAFTKP
ncbi:hypothetical protein M378DRAFT_170281 [Amanita muscaria Koide BX008]|uniref:Uncharacterized protein n=1 Tax=Amanita muscaria (strain Koide BX008) TaxID=946122 RepID=A0A0C2S7H4_AMAMK|nr:hypothetical protein M378DRAFT_170281 [Amanita muscaria Koide BX008]